MKKILPLIFVISLVLLGFGYAQECNLELDADTIVVGTISSVIETPEYFKPGIPISNVFVSEVIKGSKDLDRKYVNILLNSSEELSAFKGHEKDTVKVYLKLSFYDPDYGDIYELVCGSQGKETTLEAGMPNIPEKYYNEWQEFSKKYYGPNDIYRNIVWDNTRNIPTSIALGMYDSEPTNDYETKAKEFLLENKQLLGVDVETLKLSKIKDIRGSTTLVNFVQFYESIPVFQSYVKLNFYNADGRINLFSSNYYPNINVETDPSISKNEAIDIAIKESGLDKSKVEASGELIIYSTNNKPTLTYLIRISSTEGVFAKIYFIDAQDGKILKIENMVLYSSEESTALIKDQSMEIINSYKKELYILVGGIILILGFILLFVIYKKRKIKNQEGSGS